MNMNENQEPVMPGINVTLPCKEIRRIAREKMKGNWMKLIVAFVIFEIFTTLISTILNSYFNYSVTTDNVGAFFGLTAAQIAQAGIAQKSVLVPFGGFFYNLIIAPSFTVGLCGLLLTFFRNKEIKNQMLFDGFSFWSKAMMLNIMMVIRTFLWSLLFIIPGIIAGIRYVMAMFVLADHPGLTPSQCIDESKRLMKGNKAHYFVLCLTFFGWMLLSVIPQSIIQAPEDFPMIANCFATFLLEIPVFIVLLYMRMTTIVFYEIANGNLRIVSKNQANDALNEPVEIEPKEEITDSDNEEQ